jgi:hypothetical protein
LLSDPLIRMIRKRRQKINSTYTKNIVYKEVLTPWKSIVFCFVQLLYFYICVIYLTFVVSISISGNRGSLKTMRDK